MTATGYPGLLSTYAEADSACVECLRPVKLAPWLPQRAEDLGPDDVVFCGNCLAVCVLRGVHPLWTNPEVAAIARRNNFWAGGLSELRNLPPALTSAHLRNPN